jgi:hypothetical protein
MRLTLQIFATFFLASLLLGGLMMMAIDFKNAADIADLNSNFIGKLALGLAGDSGVSAGRLQFSGAVWAILALGSIVGIVATFLKKHTFGIVVGSSLLALAVLVVILQPRLEMREGNIQSMGMVIAFFGSVGVSMMLMLHTKLKQ